MTSQRSSHTQGHKTPRHRCSSLPVIGLDNVVLCKQVGVCVDANSLTATSGLNNTPTNTDYHSEHPASLQITLRSRCLTSAYMLIHNIPSIARRAPDLYRIRS